MKIISLLPLICQVNNYRLRPDYENLSEYIIKYNAIPLKKVKNDEEILNLN